MSLSAPLLILSDNGFIAQPLMRRLAFLGRGAKVVRPEYTKDLPPGFSSLPFNLNEHFDWSAPEGTIVLSLVPIGTLLLGLPRFAHVSRLIVMERMGGLPPERDELINQEQRLTDWSLRNRIPVTRIVPTMLYDGKTDQNVARMARFARRYRFLPLPGAGQGLCQPLHADDAAAAMLAAAMLPDPLGQTLAIAGGEVLSYHTLAERILTSLGIEPRVVHCSPNMLSLASDTLLYLSLTLSPLFEFGLPASIEADTLPDISQGLALLNLKPRSFAPPALRKAT